MMLCSVCCSATPILLCLRWTSGSLSQGNVVWDEDLPVEVEIDTLGPFEELDHDLGVLGGGLQDVFLGPIVQDQLHRESPVFPTTVFGPRDLHVRDLADPDRLLGVLLRHLISLLPRDRQLSPTFVPAADAFKLAGPLTRLSCPGRSARRRGLSRT